MIAKDFNQKIYSLQDIPEIPFISKTTNYQLVDFYREQYKEDIKAYKSLMKDLSSEEEDKGRNFYNDLDGIEAHNLDNMLEL